MFDIRRFPSPRRRLLIWCLVLSLLAMQGLGAHFHTFTDHEPLHGHGHAMELHVGGLSTDSGHDDPDNETVLDKFIKFKRLYMEDAVPGLAVALSLFLLMPAGQLIRRPRRLFHPPPGGDVRKPPLRAPPV